MARKYLTLSRDDYIQTLQKHICHVLFEKTNGDLRGMTCTLVEGLIPKTEKDVVEERLDKPKRQVNENIIPVFDLEKGSWRSFRLDKVLAIKKRR